MTEFGAVRLPWRPCEKLERFIVDADGKDVCLMIGYHLPERMIANSALILSAGAVARALRALGNHSFQMEDGTPARGYCFCPQPHPGVPEEEHTQECRDARMALKKAGVPLVTVIPEE